MGVQVVKNLLTPRKNTPSILIIFLLGGLFWGLLHSVQNTSPTYDEHEYIARGYTFLKTGDTHLQLRHPVLLDTLATVPLLLLPDIEIPVDHPSLAAGNFHVYARRFLWEVNADYVERILFLARLPTMMLSLLLAAAVFRWTREQFGLKAGLLSLGAYVFDPNLPAHGRLVTPDLGQTAFIFFAVFTWWRYLQKANGKRWLLAGGMLGLAQTAGFPALIVYPVLGVITIVYGWQRDRLHSGVSLLGALLGTAVFSILVIWAVYGFTWGVLEPYGISVPAPYHWQEFLSLLQRLDRQDLAFLRGDVYRGGRWMFFVVAWFVKTPLPTILLIFWGVAALFVRRTVWRNMAIWLLPIVYYGNALISDLNIGYRHILPLLPFAYVIAGASVLWGTAYWQRLLRAGAVGWLLWGTVSIFPFYLTYFNEVAGGPSGGRHYLVVSDLDWGQDLPRLAQYLDEQGIDDPFLSWFGTAPPEHYGIRYQPLPAWPPRGNPQQYAFHPDYPLPGVYAISAANLEGARFEDRPDTFAWFRQQEPEAVIGNSVFIYRVPFLLDVDAPPANVLLSGATLDEVPATVIADRMHTNNMLPRWFNSRRALIFPEGRSFLLHNTAVSLDPDLANLLEGMHAAQSFTNQQAETLHLYEQDMGALIKPYLQSHMQQQLFLEPLSTATSDELVSIDGPADVGTVAKFLGYQLLTDAVVPGQEMKLLTFWQAKQRIDAPLSIFVHLLAPDGSILAQHDGFDVAVAGWYPNDIVVQLHTLTVPPVVPDATNRLAVGMYRTDTQMRYPLSFSSLPGREVDRLFVRLGTD